MDNPDDADDPNERIYPTILNTNSDFRDRMITVAAHDLEEEIATFSDWEKIPSTLPDAPGCGLNTSAPGGSVQTVAGTSFAAPLVSFTAGLLMTEGIRVPLLVKNRILSSVALEKDLRYDIWSGGRLDIINAVAIQDDIVVENKQRMEEILFSGSSVEF